MASMAFPPRLSSSEWIPRSLRQNGEPRPAAKHKDQEPAGERYAAREAGLQRRARRGIPIFRAAHRDELEDDHVDAGRQHDRHLDPERDGDEVLSRLADEQKRAR